jgi:hypothetical protein
LKVVRGLGNGLIERSVHNGNCSSQAGDLH